MKKLLIPFASLILLAACSKKDSTSSTNIPDGKIAPDGFTYQTTKQINVDVTLLTNTDEAIANVPVSIFSFENNGKGDKIGTAVTDANGKINYDVAVPAYIDTFIVTPNFIGVLNNAKVALNGTSLSCTLGGVTGFKGNVVGTFDALIAKESRNKISTFDINGTKTSTKFTYMGTANALGVPDYLLKTNDAISADLLTNITNTLPEYKNLSTSISGSSYLSSNATANIILTQEADVWITFVYEGAGNRNSFGYYKYATNNPPTSLADIKNITFVFPNASLSNSGGGLLSGNKVYLGRIGKDTTVGFVLYGDGWNASMGGNNVKTGNPAYFSDAYLNPEKVNANKKHTVLIDYKDPKTSLDYYLVGFEDLNRESASCDNDFNDCIFYATANPVGAVNRTGIKPVITPLDTDGDGVCDALDEYPNDPTRAYNNHYPSTNKYGTIAFEDNWPLKGDYDLNDLVVSYHYNLVTNAKNQIVEIFGNFAPIAAGANYQNAFGVQLPFATSSVSTVTGQRLTNGYIKQNSNGTEAGQAKAVFIPFDGTKQMISNSDGNPFINTLASEPKVIGDTSHIYIKFTTPQKSVDPATFNPFCISNMRRGYEIHLPGFAPTSLVDKSLFGTGNDASNINSGTYYVTKNNYPFAINFATSFSYPTETTPINNAYLHFFDWSGSNGSSYLDWYSNKASSYINSANIYNK